MKYKLIKTYPGSPILNTIFSVDNDNILESNTTYCSNITKYLEFWKKVDEKDYEIISYISKDRIYLTNLGFNSNMNSLYNIHSVKRLLDGIIFSINDDILEQNEHSKIESFKVRGEDIVIKINHQVTKGSSVILLKSNFNHLKPLFRTEDGIDIFNNVYFWYVTPVFTVYKDIVPLKNTISNASYENLLAYSKGHHVKFSTKEKAEEYILLNKPQYSLNDILKKLSECNNITYTKK